MATTAPPKQITREDRRLIMEWLDLNYDPDNQRYIKDWDDEKASKTLARPRAWIAQIRDEFFGPAWSRGMALGGLLRANPGLAFQVELESGEPPYQTFSLLVRW